MAGKTVRKVARTFRLSCRQVSRLAPLRGPRSILRAQGGKGMDDVTLQGYEFRTPQIPDPRPPAPKPDANDGLRFGNEASIGTKSHHQEEVSIMARLQAKDGEYKKQDLVTIEMDAFRAMLFAPQKLEAKTTSMPGILAQARDDIVEERLVVAIADCIGPNGRLGCPGSGIPILTSVWRMPMLTHDLVSRYLGECRLRGLASATTEHTGGRWIA